MKWLFSDRSEVEVKWEKCWPKWSEVELKWNLHQITEVWRFWVDFYVFCSVLPHFGRFWTFGTFCSFMDGLWAFFNVIEHIFWGGYFWEICRFLALWTGLWHFGPFCTVLEHCKIVTEVLRTSVFWNVHRSEAEVDQKLTELKRSEALHSSLDGVTYQLEE